MIDHSSATRRTFLKNSLLFTGGLATASGIENSIVKERSSDENSQRPNILFILVDQLRFDSISSHGCKYVKTPNIDRLVNSGVSFTKSYSTNPVCSPARSSLMTSRMPSETGVITNNRAINEKMPNLGQCLRAGGYDTYYVGKWHLNSYYPEKIEGFEVFPSGAGEADTNDPVVSSICQSFLASYKKEKPFLLVANLLQPHDVCFIVGDYKSHVPEELPFKELEGKLPPVPQNLNSRPAAPQIIDRQRFDKFKNDQQWQYYAYIYYRQVEMLDADVGRILDALEASGNADNTLIIFTSDHGEELGEHGNVGKWFPYNGSLKVPLICSLPGRIDGCLDEKHLVSGIDILPTICDYADIDVPEHAVGMSVRPLLEKQKTRWREYLGAEFMQVGRVLLSSSYKYIKCGQDGIEQLFDINTDSFEMNNLYDDEKYSDVLKDHRSMLDKWEAKLDISSPSPLILGGKVIPEEWDPSTGWQRTRES